jgi:hypothetical protein
MDVRYVSPPWLDLPVERLVSGPAATLDDEGASVFSPRALPRADTRVERSLIGIGIGDRDKKKEHIKA